MDSLEMNELFGRIYENKAVLITGHTGFKGSWLALWLSQIGAKVIGYALPPPTSPSHAELLGIECLSNIGDIRDSEKLQNVIHQHKPEIIFHLAAQPLVRASYKNPVETFSTNIMGTINLLEACKDVPGLKAVVIVTSDKCYENKEWLRAYRENDPLGGYDPYSASKGCVEIITSSYRHSFFPVAKYGSYHSILLASARAGNAIGGGDWAQDRIIPDIVRAASRSETILIRSPKAIRPWQHVLELLSGYLMLGRKLLEAKPQFAQAWNFGPRQEDNLDVKSIVQRLQRHWKTINYQLSAEDDLHEANLLKLDSSKANSNLNWTPVWTIDEAIEMTGEWYRSFYEHNEIISEQQLKRYIQAAKQKNLQWAETNEIFANQA